MGTHKPSSTGKTAKANHKHSAKGKESKPVSKLSSIKQALFGGGAPKKVVAPAHSPVHPPAKAPKKENLKPAAKLVKGPAKEPAVHGHHAPAPAKAKEAAPTHQPAKKAAPVFEARTKKSLGGSSGRSAHGRGYDSSESVCREVACEGLATSAGYCRLHYIKNWKKIKRKDVILKEGKLNQYIEELVVKYPDKYIEAIRQDLANDKDFAKVIYDLDLDETSDDFDADAEASDTIIDSIKRDFDDEGDTGF